MQIPLINTATSSRDQALTIISSSRMDDQLVSLFDSFGQNARLRKANLRNLVPSLRPWEARDLAEAILPLYRWFDLVPHLPTELLSLIAQYFQEEDIYSVLAVSSPWRNTWLQLDILRPLAERWLPGFQGYVAYVTKLTGEQPDELALLYAAFRKRHFRSLGIFRSALIVNDWKPTARDRPASSLAPSTGFRPSLWGWDDAFTDTFSRDELRLQRGGYLYFDGKFAWQPNALRFPQSQAVVVDDLQAQTRSIYRVPEIHILAEAVTIKALGDELVVAAGGRRVLVFTHSRPASSSPPFCFCLFSFFLLLFFLPFKNATRES